MSNIDQSLSAGINAPPIKFYYKNWRGECGYRTIHGAPMFWYGESPYHKGEQWFIRAFDAEKQNAVRDFAVNDIIEFVKA